MAHDLDEIKRVALENGQDIADVIEGAPFTFMEECSECGHINDVHFRGDRYVFTGCDDCVGDRGYHAFQGNHTYGTRHPGLGDWIDGEWVRGEDWEQYKRARFKRMFPMMDRQLEERAAS